MTDQAAQPARRGAPRAAPRAALRTGSAPSAGTTVSRTTGGTVLRPEIALAWRRSELSGLLQSDTLEGITQQDFDRRSRLLVAAAPVLDDIEEHLQDTRLCVILADDQARIVDRRVGQRSMSALLDMVRAVPGSVFDEASTGSNSIATTFELRQGVKVLGSEHYIERLRQFSCYGHPILHPITRRLEGVLDITGYAEDTTDLLAPYLLRAVREIEDRLLQGSRAAHQRLLNAYQIAATRTLDPVVVLGEGVTLANQPAIDQVAPTDFVVIRALAADVPQHQTLTTTVTLESGQTVEVQCEPIPRSDGVLVRLEPTESPFFATARVVPDHRALARPAAPPEPAGLVLVSGEAGTGRSTAAREAAGERRVTTVDALGVAGQGESAWLAGLDELLVADGAVVIENIHLLPSILAARLRARLADGDVRARVIATSAPTQSLGGEHAALAAVFMERTETTPLRHNRGGIPALVTDMLADLGSTLEVSPALMDRLVNQSWPGNLQELRSVVRVLAAAPHAGPLTPDDLPEAYRSGSASRVRTPLEQSEYDTIVAALRDCDGNKVQAAKQLGIARATLYSRIRRFRIRA